jgi:5-methylcytosine-specific restriction endonuclease McrA
VEVQKPKHGNTPKFCSICRPIATKEQQRARDAKRPKRDPAAKAVYDSEYRVKNFARVKLRKRRWQVENMKHAVAKAAAWKRAHPEQTREINRRYDREHPEKARARLGLRRARLRGARIGDQKAVRAFYRAMRLTPLVPCYYCGKNTKPGKRYRHVDHIIPISRGGAHSVENLCCACQKCNASKSTKTPGEFTGQLLLL